jgi:uncharacterized protein
MGCPICDNDAVAKYRPFCSGRCADIDLGRWFNGAYAVASQSEDDVEELAGGLAEAHEKKITQPH